MRFILYFILLVSAPALADQDADFLAANDAFRAGDAAKLQRFAQRLKNTPLEVYVEYYQLRLNLDKADAGAIEKFLSRPEDTPMVDQLRGEWLRVLGNKQQWDLFDAEYPKLLDEDAELACYHLQSRLRNNDQAALREARALWFSGKAQPESCAAVFEAAISSGIITQQDINQRLRLALESGNVSLAKQLFARLEGDQGVSPKSLESAASDALRYLDKLNLDDRKALLKSAQESARTNPDVPVNTHSSIGATNFYTITEYPLRHLLRAADDGWRGDIAAGCLNFTPVLQDSGFPVLGTQHGESSGPGVCPDPCGIFSISAILAMRQSGEGAGQTILSLSDLQSGGMDTAAIESILENIRPAGKDTLPSSSSKQLAAGTLKERTGWSAFWEQLGLGSSGNTAMSAPDSGSSVSTVCDPCTVAGEASTVTPMEWNPKLASEGQRAVVLFALQRLARQSLDQAAARWIKFAPYFPAPEQHYFYGRLAYEAARDLDDRALQWYKAAANTPLNEQQAAWRVRAALRTQDWQEVLASINAMSEQQQRDAAWRYWKARALQATEKSVEARNIYAPLSSEYHFYGLLAGEELADTPVISEAGAAYKPDNRIIAEMEALPGVQRSLALYRMGLRNEALEEWRWLVRNLNDRELLTAAEIARRNEMYDRAIGAAEKTLTVHDFSLRYLAPYREVLQEHIQEHGLEEAWVYGLMRQESRFVSSAKSSVGAAGLMQIMPATARWVANRLGLKSYRNKLIHQLDTNLRLGTYYMKSVLSQFDDSPVLATAAYNAGPRRARQWRGDRPMEGAIYAETIPFEETRDYVKKVMSNTMYYAIQFNAPLRTLKKRLGIVPGKGVENPKNMPSVPG
ncbi:MAG: transglycosylase SLT domain-containing protein [Pseudomonadota bacterium]